MRYVAEIDGQTYNVDIDDWGGALHVRLNEQPVAADLCQVAAPNLFSLIRDGTSHEVFAERVDKGYVVVIAGERFIVNVADERTLRLARVQKPTVERRGDMVVKSPMPGLVVEVCVAVGDVVTSGQSLLILMAMKMENEIRAFEGGIVKAIHVQKGDKVELGQVLATIS